MGKSIDLGGGGGTSFQFDRVGATVTGTITDLEEVQQTDLKDGKPKYFDSGAPMMMYQASLQTDLRGGAGLSDARPDDDGVRTVYLKGSRKPESQSSLAAVLAAVKAATGTNHVAVGGRLTLTYVGDGVAQRGQSAPKLYSAKYEPPSVSLGGEEVSATPAATTTTTASTAEAGKPDLAAIEASLPEAQRNDPAVRAALGLPPLAAADNAWEANPAVPALRAAGKSDEEIRALLGI